MMPAHSPVLFPAMLEAAARALLAALALGGLLRLFRVGNVLAQKAAWGLMLAAALTMPFMMRWHLLPDSAVLRLPVPAWKAASKAENTMRASLALETDTLVAQTNAPAPSEGQPFTSLDTGNTAGNRFPAPSISKSEFASPARASVSVDLPAGASAPEILLAAARAGIAPLRFELANLRLQPANLSSLLNVTSFLYAAVLGFLLLRWTIGLALALRLWSGASPIDGLLGDDYPSLRLRSSTAVASPVTVGSGVVLPADYEEWDAEKLRIVLAHERSHVRQGDFYLQMLAAVYAAVFWFSPLGWWLKSKLSDLGEAISDRAGIEEAASRTSYAQVLLEFAALPRPTALGVAMARSSNLSHRIERILNDSSFRRAFAASRPRILLAAIVLPIAILAGAAMIRVEAAQDAPAPPPATAPNPAPAPPAVPDAAPASAANPTPSASDAAPAIAASPNTVPSAAPAPGAVAVPAAPLAPPAPEYREIRDAADYHNAAISYSQDQATMVANEMKARQSTSIGKGYSYSYSSNGDSWALITDLSDRVTFSGDWHDSTRESIEKVRKIANGKFLWFMRDGKEYFIDDPTTIEGIQAMYKPMEELGRQQEELGKQQEALGRQQEELGRKQEQASIPTPDMSKEMQRLNQAVAQLQAKKGGTVTQEDLADLEGRIGEIQGRLGELQGQVGAKQGELGAEQGRLGAKQGELGAQQGRLGAEQGRIGQEADRKIRTIITESLQNGKAKPVQ